MKVTVQAKSMPVTAAIRDFVAQKTKSLLGRVSKEAVAIQVYLEKIVRKKNDQTSTEAKVRISVPGKDIVVKEKSHDLYLAMQKALSAASQQLKKLKDKKQEKNRPAKTRRPMLG